MIESRRDFLKTAAGTVAVSALPLAAQPAGGKSDVYVGKGKAEAMIPALIEKMGGMGRFVKKGGRVLIHPNMGFANPPDWGTTTSPEAVAAVVKLCLDAGAKRVIVADNTLREPELCKEKTGIAAALKQFPGATLFVPKDDNLYEEKTSDKAKVLTRTDVLKELGRVDTYISLPTAKSHAAGGISMNLKGQMGLVKNRGTMHSEMDLHQAVADLMLYMKPTLNILDASRALLDNGPAGPGTVKQLDTFLAGTDAVAVDAYGVTLAQWYGKRFEGKSVKHLKIAADMGLGNIESSMINIVTV